MIRWDSFPLFVYLLGISGLAMLLPAIHAVRLDHFAEARAFFYSGLLTLFAALLVSLAMLNQRSGATVRSHLVTLIASYLFLPLVLAIPLLEVAPATDILRAYFEMVSSLTTTGATLFSDPTSVSEVIHLWRAIVAWLGGLFALIAALAIMEPLNLGGFEIRSSIHGGKPSGAVSRHVLSGTEDRILRQASIVAPIYLVLTLILALALILLGDRPFVASCHAMSIISTSGISPIGGLGASPSGYFGEGIMALFLVMAISHRIVLDLLHRGDADWFKQDAEVRLALSIVLAVGLVLFVRHWLAAFDLDAQEDLASAAGALWGTLFTGLSFLTTTGFESRSWGIAQGWSGLETSGVFLIGLVAIGGGIATTAGGVKLLRVYALYKHGVRELEKLAHPSSIGGSGTVARRIRREGAFIAWMFLMIFVVTLSIVMVALSMTGANFDEAMLLAIAALSTTGPLVGSVSGQADTYSQLPPAAQAILCIAMILGRLEALAVIALLNPGYWRQ